MKELVLKRIGQIDTVLRYLDRVADLVDEIIDADTGVKTSIFTIPGLFRSIVVWLNKLLQERHQFRGFWARYQPLDIIYYLLLPCLLQPLRLLRFRQTFTPAPFLQRLLLPSSSSRLDLCR